MSLLAPYRKTVAAVLGAFAGTLGAQLADGDMTRPEVFIAAGAALVAGAATFAAPRNTDA